MRRTLSAALLPGLLAACGGGISDNNNTTPAPAPVPAYRFAGPKLGQHLEYAATLIDTMGNTLNRTVTVDVTAVGADGSFTEHEEDPAHDTVSAGGASDTLYPTDYQYDAAGRPSAWTIAEPGASVHCTVAGSEGAPAALASGSDWNTSYVETCGANPGIAFSQSGTLAGIESVTVPAGTFNAYKFESSTSWTANGITTNETSTLWRDASGSGSRTIKEAAVFTYSGGTPPASSPLQRVRQLQSYR